MPQTWDEHGNPIDAGSVKTWDENGNPVTQPSGIENALSHAGDRLSELPGAIANTVLHPIDTAKAMYGQQKQLFNEGVDAVRHGDYPLGLARAYETIMPGVGPAVANGFKTIKSGDTSGGIGDMIGTVGPAIALRAASMSPKVQAFGRGMYEGATSPTDVPLTLGHGMLHLRVPGAPASVSGAVSGALGSRLVGMHPMIGASIGAAVPAIRGGMRAASEAPWMPEVEGPVPSPFVPSPQRLLNRGGIVMPPPETPDASFVRGVPAMAHPPNPARALPPASQAIPMGGDIAGDSSFVRGVPAVPHPPNVMRVLPPGGRAFEMPTAADSSFVRGIQAQYAEPVTPTPIAPHAEEISPTVLTEPKNIAPAPVSDNSAITQQYKPSRTNARFDTQGRRIDRNGRLMFPQVYKEK